VTAITTLQILIIPCVSSNSCCTQAAREPGVHYTKYVIFDMMWTY